MTRARKKTTGRAEINLRDIGKRIRELRGLDMTQAEFAGASASRKATYQHWSMVRKNQVQLSC